MWIYCVLVVVGCTSGVVIAVLTGVFGGRSGAPLETTNQALFHWFFGKFLNVVLGFFVVYTYFDKVVGGDRAISILSGVLSGTVLVGLYGLFLFLSFFYHRPPESVA